MTSFFGKSHDDKMAAFDDAVASIEEKYTVHLRTVFDHENNEIIDKLSNHYVLQWEPNLYGGLRYGLGWRPDAYIPQFIQDEVTSIFTEIFSS